MKWWRVKRGWYSEEVLYAEELVGAVALETPGTGEAPEDPRRNGNVGADQVSGAEKRFDGAQQIIQMAIADIEFVAG